ncbi:hypothetical protein OSB04_007389 [Centaurea solstitialis]|uniref:C2H2-type domain-containing protein n=1 Tax=Centaurea solstitialis TaxID=347529 RepID=A0AA38TJT7_9ASTR|nr:hypothetical protein OSB04_007389 [Centaurea solstitialis]
MIKRRFFKQEHGDNDAASGSSSSSDSELDAEASVDSEEEDDDHNNNMVAESRKKDQPCSSSSGSFLLRSFAILAPSWFVFITFLCDFGTINLTEFCFAGYESEDSSGNEVNLDASGVLSDDDGSGGEDYKQDVVNTPVFADNRSDKKAITNDVLDCVLKSKSVFKCKLCPRIVCLTEETLKAHLKSKRHARSEKLLKEGRLKMMLNSDGEIEGEEEDGETHQERHAATLALAQVCHQMHTFRDHTLFKEPMLNARFFLILAAENV